ncbi:MAG: S8/S53 family peptidase [Bacteroidota bacterium]
MSFQFIDSLELSGRHRLKLAAEYSQAFLRLRKFPIGIDPIDEVEFPKSLAGGDSYAINALDVAAFIQDYSERLLQSPIRLVFVVHDTAGEPTAASGFMPYTELRWCGDNTGTGPAEDHFHSHNVASCILGEKDGDWLGLLWPLAKAGKAVVVFDKVLSKGGGQFAWIAAGLNRTAEIKYEDNDLVIHVNSYGAGGVKTHPLVDAAVQRCIDAGHLFLASAGNSGHDSAGNSRVGYPANLEAVAAIGAVDVRRNRKSYSSTGPEVYATSFSGVPCINPDGSLSNREGTSFSQPILSALVGLYGLFLGRKIDQVEMLEFLRTRRIDLGDKGRDVFFGYGLPLASLFAGAPGDDPGEGPGDEPPVTQPEDHPAAQVISGPFVYRYMTQDEYERGSTFWRILVITELESMTFSTSRDKAALRLQQMMEEHFVDHSHAMVIPNNEGATEALAYVAMFLYYFSRRLEQPVYTKRLAGANETGLHIATTWDDENRGGFPNEYLEAKYVDAFLVDVVTGERLAQDD